MTEKHTNPAITILRCHQVAVRTGLSRSTIYQLIHERRFPAPISLGRRAVGWVQSEIDDYLAARIAERDAGTAP